MKQLIVGLTITGLLAVACGGSPIVDPIAGQPLAPPAPRPSTAALAAAATAMSLLEALPCPPPGLPAELTAQIDCAAFRGISGAVAYVPRQVALGALPPAVDLRVDGLVGPVRDQAHVGACSAFAIAATMDNAVRRFGLTEPSSSLHIYSTYASNDLDLGEAVRGRPIALEPTWPYDPVRACRLTKSDSDGCGGSYGVSPGSGIHDPGLQSERARADASGRWRVDGFEQLAGPGIDGDQLALLLAGGEAVYATFAFYRPAWEAVRGGYDVMPHYDVAQASSFHAVTLEGYRRTPQGRQFLIHNSWGRDWGAGGYAWVDEALVSTAMRHGYRLRVAPATAWAPPGQGATAPPAVPALPDLSALPAVALPTCGAGTIPWFGGCQAVPGW